VYARKPDAIENERAPLPEELKGQRESWPAHRVNREPSVGSSGHD
jgi:hypothetical protein